MVKCDVDAGRNVAYSDSKTQSLYLLILEWCAVAAVSPPGGLEASPTAAQRRSFAEAALRGASGVFVAPGHESPRSRGIVGRHG